MIFFPLMFLHFSGHKIKPQYDFDFVALDLLNVYPEDSGTYTCTARNALGEATTTSTVKISGKDLSKIDYGLIFFIKCTSIFLYFCIGYKTLIKG